MSSCAICTSRTGPFTPQPLGRNNALVPVCAACDEPAFEKRGPERGYEPTGGLLDADELSTAKRRVMGDETYERQSKLDEEWGRLSAPPVDEDEWRIRDHVYETVKRHHTRTNYANRTSAEKAKR